MEITDKQLKAAQDEMGNRLLDRERVQNAFANQGGLTLEETKQELQLQLQLGELFREHGAEQAETIDDLRIVIAVLRTAR